MIKFNVETATIDNLVYRKCRECRLLKELNELNFIKRSTENGWRGRCRVCYNKQTRVKQETNNTEKARSKRYNERNKLKDPIGMLFRTTKSNAKKYSREFSISKEDIENMLNKQRGRCYYTNRPLTLFLGTDTSLSLDRKDSNLGYTKDNVVLTQYRVNVMKNNASIADLINFCKDIIATHANYT